MAEIKVSEKEINELINKHGLNKYVKNCWNVEIDPKEIIYQLNLTELDKCKKLHLMISCLIYNTIVKTAKKEYRSAKLRSKKPKSVEVK